MSNARIADRAVRYLRASEREHRRHSDHEWIAAAAIQLSKRVRDGLREPVEDLLLRAISTSCISERRCSAN